MESMSPPTLLFFKTILTTLGPLYTYVNFESYDPNLGALGIFFGIAYVDNHTISHLYDFLNFIFLPIALFKTSSIIMNECGYVNILSSWL